MALELALAGGAASVTAIAPAGLWPEPLLPKRATARHLGAGAAAGPRAADALGAGAPARAGHQRRAPGTDPGSGRAAARARLRDGAGLRGRQRGDARRPLHLARRRRCPGGRSAGPSTTGSSRCRGQSPRRRPAASTSPAAATCRRGTTRTRSRACCSTAAPCDHSGMEIATQRLAHAYHQRRCEFVSEERLGDWRRLTSTGSRGPSRACATNSSPPRARWPPNRSRTSTRAHHGAAFAIAHDARWPIALVYWWEDENEIHSAGLRRLRAGRADPGRPERDGLRVGARRGRVRAPRLDRGPSSATRTVRTSTHTWRGGSQAWGLERNCALEPAAGRGGGGGGGDDVCVP